ncbi:MAG: sulfotransferase [Cyanobacteria bacterium P01_F01_bin.143]
MSPNYNITNYHPVAVGGIGGSGTRIVSRILQELSFYLGDDLNKQFDNLWFTLLFKRKGILQASLAEIDVWLSIFIKGMISNEIFTQDEVELINHLALSPENPHPEPWLKERAKSLLARDNSEREIKRWGWKEPNTHIIIEQLHHSLPKLKYIHVVRNGLDMAYSRNQNQLKLWGFHFLQQEYQISPYYSLKYWVKVHEHILDVAQLMQDKFLWLNYDELCLNPHQGIDQIIEFLELEIPSSHRDRISNLVKVPDSKDRFKNHGLDLFERSDIALVGEFGFDNII